MDVIINEFFNEIDLDAFQQCDETDEGTCVNCLSTGYFDGIQIDYSCETKRKLYVVRYLPVHVKEVREALELIPRETTDELLNNENLRVLCIGGGPGTDNYAINQWITNKSLVTERALTTVELTRMDKCVEWNDISARIVARGQPEDVVFDLYRDTVDITQLSSKEDSAKLIVMSYILSEIEDDQLPTLADNLSQLTDDEWTLVVNDRNETHVIEKIDTLIELLGGETAATDGQRLWCGFSFPEKIREAVRPKLNTSSIRYVAKI